MKRRIIWGMILLIIALALIFSSLGLLPIEKTLRLWDFWPMILIGIGINGIGRKRDNLFSIGMLALGAYFLYGNLGFNVPRISFELIVAIILLYISISFIISAIRRLKPKKINKIDDSHNSVFSHNKLGHEDGLFTNGNLTVVFGGTEFDLSKSKIDPMGAILSCSVTFGGIKIYVPSGTNVQTRGYIFAGGIEHKRKDTESSASIDNGILTVEVSGAFGGVQIVDV